LFSFSRDHYSEASLVNFKPVGDRKEQCGSVFQIVICKKLLV